MRPDAQDFILKRRSEARADITPGPFPLGLPIATPVGFQLTALLPEVPLPTKIRTSFQEPVQVDADPDRAQDEKYVKAKYDEVCASIQTGMDALARRRRLPLFG